MRSLLLCALLTVALLVMGCSAEKPAETKIRIGILPIEDSLPIVVAGDEGIFSKHGLEVEIISFNSALERDAALMAGDVDAVITDPLAVILLRDKEYDVRIVSICLGKKPDEGVFAILAAPNSTISTVKDLNGKEIAISSNTIIEYITDVMLSKYNISYKKVEIKQIPVRLRTLLDGKVDAATLPEPLASYAMSQGAKLILSDAMMNESLTQTVIVFRGDFVDDHKDEVKKFLESYREAVKKINSEKDRYREKFIEVARVPENIANSYPMPEYPEPEKFPINFYQRYLDWATKKSLISKEVAYEEAVADI
ncbi:MULTISPECIES: MetQ/NlpA family ABC transporter substrate-binding protein [unclassified Archaeoglobus]|jgi:NitT/TauT family transport system substrate-binding protein|uniref:MetQ/NlpA family ABC transporter substrate-binding protein n=1 Tax=unclassified Archaeoglobus TaxID=2643606 RepID=UPI0025C23440|nr:MULTISPECIES: MetQ/NlpA family ABC transporter substrate-binding protein [unclassified Archaeoglobus]